MNELLKYVREIFAICDKKNLKIRVAESCTGGYLASLFTLLPGSSKYFDYGIVAYSNEAKHKFLNISLDTLVRYGAVSIIVSEAMTKAIAGKNIIALSTTGLIGPKGDETNIKVGTVYVSIATENSTYKTKELIVNSSREENRELVVKSALQLARESL